MPESRRYLKCKVAECTSAVHAKGYCQRHYTRHWRLNKVRRKIICKVNGCDAPVHSKGYCRKLKNRKRHGLTKWRMPTTAELGKFRSTEVDRLQYWSNEKDGEKAKVVTMMSGRITDRPMTDLAPRAFCVSRKSSIDISKGWPQENSR